MPSALIETRPWLALAATGTIASPSGSESLPSTAIVTARSSSVVTRSSAATGAGLTIVQAKPLDRLAPDGSVAVTVTRYGPCPLAPAVSVPLIRPVAGSMLNPGGRPVAA